MDLNASTKITLCPQFQLASYIQSNLLRNFGLPDMGVGYQKFQAGSLDGYPDFGVISTPASPNHRALWLHDDDDECSY